MSSYENYSETANTYDVTRVPMGIEVILSGLATGPVPLGEAKVLDAGCGTGSYAAVLAQYVVQVCAIDLNPEMLAVARKKLPGEVSVQQAPIDCLPFDDAQFDGIMVNQVLHHISDDSQSDYPSTRKIFNEFARVLKTQGRLSINTCTRDQLRGGWWYYQLIPETVMDMCARYIPIDELCRLLKTSELTLEQQYVPVDALMQGEDYFNPRGPLSQTWRNGDSIWACASVEELRDALAKVRAMDALKELENYVHQHDKMRRQVGQVTFVLASRRGIIDERSRGVI